ncbi:hypothetical protein [Undibacterium sp.]|uniref:hypothetical protein n=1 Tax=Undibacterium sp. TaxID=1914977 RepID=UPI00272A850F|nr:hypothetical protein [Undibacterium sp.]
MQYIFLKKYRYKKCAKNEDQQIKRRLIDTGAAIALPIFMKRFSDSKNNILPELI